MKITNKKDLLNKIERLEIEIGKATHKYCSDYIYVFFGIDLRNLKEELKKQK